MALTANGLVKLIEECGELQQIAAKKLNYPNTDIHPDGQGSMQGRLEQEIADVYAALRIVIELHGLNNAAITRRAVKKYELFIQWQAEE